MPGEAYFAVPDVGAGAESSERFSLSSFHISLPFKAPNWRLPLGATRAGPATGLPLRAMTTSTPATTCALHKVHSNWLNFGEFLMGI